MYRGARAAYRVPRPAAHYARLDHARAEKADALSELAAARRATGAASPIDSSEAVSRRLAEQSALLEAKWSALIRNLQEEWALERRSLQSDCSRLEGTDHSWVQKRVSRETERACIYRRCLNFISRVSSRLSLSAPAQITFLHFELIHEYGIYNSSYAAYIHVNFATV